MIKITYVIGHRNPDTDSIASAIGYASLKQRLGDSTIVVAAMAGIPNPQTRYILDRLGIPVLAVIPPGPTRMSRPGKAISKPKKARATTRSVARNGQWSRALPRLLGSLSRSGSSKWSIRSR